MFNFAIFAKTLRDSSLTLILACCGVVAFVILVVFSMLNMGAEVLEFVSKVGFIRKIFEATLGISVEGEVSINTLFSVSFTHGMVLMLAWGTLIAIATRVTAGEMERGTADLLLTLPVTRTEVFISTTIAWLVAALFLSACPIVGVAIGIQIFETDEVVELSRYVAPTINFLAINLAIASVSMMVGSFMNRRAQAVGTIVGVAFVSVVLNFIEPFVPTTSIRYLGLLCYFRPVDIVRTGEFPWASIGVLLVVASVSWTIGLSVFRSKDIPTA